MTQMDPDIEPLAQFLRTVDRLNRAVTSPIARLMQGLQPIVPPAFQLATDLQKAMRPLHGLVEANGLAKSLDEIRHTFLGLDAVMPPRLQSELDVAGRVLASYLRPFRTLADGLSTVVPPSLDEAWRQHLLGVAAPVWAALSVWEQTTLHTFACLSCLEDPDDGACLVWSRQDVDFPSTAAWLPEHHARLPTIVIQATVACAFCGDDLLVRDTEFRWKGNRKGAFGIAVVPLCGNCLTRAQAEPSYFEEALEELERPTLRLASDGGITDGIPRGQLRLVDEDDDPPDDR